MNALDRSRLRTELARLGFRPVTFQADDRTGPWHETWRLRQGDQTAVVITWDSRDVTGDELAQVRDAIEAGQLPESGAYAGQHEYEVEPEAYQLRRPNRWSRR